MVHFQRTPTAYFKIHPSDKANTANAKTSFYLLSGYKLLFKNLNNIVNI